MGWDGWERKRKAIPESITHHPQRHRGMNRLVKEHCVCLVWLKYGVHGSWKHKVGDEDKKAE